MVNIGFKMIFKNLLLIKSIVSKVYGISNTTKKVC